jgi:hypothetical protein
MHVHETRSRSHLTPEKYVILRTYPSRPHFDVAGQVVMGAAGDWATINVFNMFRRALAGECFAGVHASTTLNARGGAADNRAIKRTDTRFCENRRSGLINLR